MSYDNLDRLQAGDVKIITAVVYNKENKGIDVRHLIAELIVYENIFAAFITASLTLQDSIGLSTLVPFVGEEVFVLEIETPTPGANNTVTKMMRRQLQFHIYKMDNQQNINMRSKLYTLNLISVAGFVDMNRAISKTFKGKTSDIAKTLLESKQYLGVDPENVIIEESTNNIIYTSNFWTPSKSLFFLAEQSVNNKQNPNYLFFENREGFVFASLDALLKAPVAQTFIRDQYVRGDRVDLDEEYRTILDMSVPDSMYDYIDRKSTGGYGGTVYEFAFDTKSIKKTVNKFDDYDHEKPNEFIPFTPDSFDPLSHIIRIPVHRNLFNGSKNLEINHHNRRAALIKKMTDFQLNIQVMGRFDYTIGRQVDVIIYKDKPIEADTPDNKIEDELLSGTYLITALSHVITKTTHKTNIELSKTGMTKKPTA